MRKALRWLLALAVLIGAVAFSFAARPATLAPWFMPGAVRT
ncbi:hypothetical protein SALBM217S_08249 [Streptomyces griseoloalbus]